MKKRVGFKKKKKRVRKVHFAQVSRQGFSFLLCKTDPHIHRGLNLSFSWSRGGLPAASIQLIQLNHGRQGSKVSVSVFANQLPSPAKRQSRLLLITKKYYPLAGGSQQHQYPKQTDTVCLEAWCLVQLSCQIQAHRSSYSRSERGRRGGLLSCMLQHHNSHFIFTSSLQN